MQKKIHERAGFIKSVIQDLTYQVTYNHLTRDGGIIVNISLIRSEMIDRALSVLKSVYEERLDDQSFDKRLFSRL